MATPARIISSQPTHQGAQAVADDRHLQRWLWMASIPISLADWSGSRFVGKFDNDLLMPKRLIALRPGHANALGVYEFPAMIMHQQDQGVGDNNGGTFLDAIAPPSTVFDTGRRERLTRYSNAPKLCGYMLMKEYERRGLALFEHLKGMEDDEVAAVYEAVIPAEVEAGWAKVKRVVLEHDFHGPFLDQIRDWLGRPGSSPMSEYAKKRGTAKDAETRARRSIMATEMRSACSRAWSFENAALNTSEQQIRRYRNGKLGKEYYDAPDERFPEAPMPLDILCLADTNRQPIDMQQVEAARVANEGTQQAMVKGMEAVADRIAEKMTSGVSLEQIEAAIDSRIKERDAFWQAEIEKLKTAKAQE